LGNKLTLEGPFKDALAKSDSALQVRFELGFGHIHDGKSAADFLNQYCLLQ
jgi:hypothetical protein